jgi:WS/DGAT/MGAT family acyltransferase
MKRLGGMDAAFLYGETPSWHMHVSSLMIIDPSDSPIGYSFEQLRDLTIERLPAVPQFRWQYVDVPFGLDRPGWIEGEIDPDFHIRRIAVPKPGGPTELGDLVGRIVSYKLDRRKPLWEMWVIEGLEGGYVALVSKIHHAIIDGVSGAGLAEVLLDLSPEPRSVELPVLNSLEGERLPSQWERLASGLVNTAFRTPVRVAKFGAQSARQLASAANVLRTGSSTSIPFQAPRTSLNAPITPRRQFDSATVSLDRAKAVKAAYGVKLNDVILALCASGLRKYLLEFNELPSQPLIAQVPVSTRTADETDSVGNRVGSMFVSLATHIEDPGLRLRAIYRSTQGAKEMSEAMSVHRIMGLTDTTPPGLIALAARMYTRSGLENSVPPPVNVVISNVPGPPFPLYIAGSRLKRLYPMGPLLFGMGLNMTVFSYVDSLDFGLMSCPDVVRRADIIATGVEEAITELEVAAGLPTPSKL